MKKILIATLGNRDLQLSSESNFPTRFYDYFEKGGTDTGSSLIVKKAGGGFLKNSKFIFDNFEELSDEVSFPMVETYLEKLGEKPDLIVLISTKQEPLDSQDCHYVVLFLQRWLEQRSYNVDYYPLECSPVDFPELVNVFSMFYDGYRGCQLYVGNSGGTPDMRAASYAAGFFKSIQFITIQARSKQVSMTNFSAQEKLVLKHTVEKMLENFDYSGILELPINSKTVRNLSRYAIARLGFDFSTARQMATSLELSKLDINQKLTPKELEQEMLRSALVKFKQKSYADYLWRLFTISENLLIPDVEYHLGGNIHFAPPKHFRWNELLKNHLGLLDYLKLQMIDSSPLIFSKPNVYVYEHILSFFEKKGKYTPHPLIENVKANFSSLRYLRNGIAHDYEGINENMIKQRLVASALPGGLATIDNFNAMLCDYTGINKSNFGIYDYVNELIKIELA
jgi:hypothetical protein